MCCANIVLYSCDTSERSCFKLVPCDHRLPDIRDYSSWWYTCCGRGTRNYICRLDRLVGRRAENLHRVQFAWEPQPEIWTGLLLNIPDQSNRSVKTVLAQLSFVDQRLENENESVRVTPKHVYRGARNTDNLFHHIPNQMWCRLYKNPGCRMHLDTKTCFILNQISWTTEEPGC